MKLSVFTIISSCLIGTTVAFIPASNLKLSTSHDASSLNAIRQQDLKGYYTSERDITDKIPKDWGFDPLGFAETKGGMFFLREAEIKHARLAMLAVGLSLTVFEFAMVVPMLLA